jgi:glycosyltransferase involved in cell wall biosynthesis
MLIEKITVSAWPKEKNVAKNPYNKLLYDAMDDAVDIKEFDKKSFNFKNTDILHIHWPDHMLRLASGFKIRLRLWKFSRLIKKLHASGGKLIWTVHNLQPHKMLHPLLIKRGLRKISEMTDGFIFLSDASKKSFFSLHPYAKNKPSVIIPHLHYKDYYADAGHKIADRIKPIQLLCFGLIRNHKGYLKLFDVARSIESYDKVAWSIAGNPGKEGVSREIESLWAQNKIIYKACRHIEDKEIIPLFGECDAVVLPYDNILNSGTAILALSLDKRVVAPAIGSFLELQQSVGSDWIYLYKQPLEKEKLEAAIDWVAKPLQNDESPDLDFMSPVIVARKTTGFYRLVLSNDA